MDLIHLPCLLRDTVFGWCIWRGNFSPFRAAELALRFAGLSLRQFSPSKACLTAIARAPKRYRSPQKRLAAKALTYRR
jgi:hypothetical protein